LEPLLILLLLILIAYSSKSGNRNEHAIHFIILFGAALVVLYPLRLELPSLSSLVMDENHRSKRTYKQQYPFHDAAQRLKVVPWRLEGEGSIGQKVQGIMLVFYGVAGCR
ncbi:unnamed protein product, partial [Linum tenue]